MHEQEAAAQGLQYVYRKFDLDELKVGVEALPELLTEAERAGYTGLNITYPCKQASCRSCTIFPKKRARSAP
jgi:shikimate dehydrogenase